MADGTPRITLDLSCSLADLAALGVDPGTEYAIARMNPAASVAIAQESTIAKEENQAMGPLCKWAVMRCKEPEFWAFLSELSEAEGLVASEASAKVFIQECYGIDSRKELDRPDVAIEFKSQIMQPWSVSKFNKFR
jgi:hypothetical protein